MKTWPIVFDPQALDDLDDIHIWISTQASPRIADEYEARIITHLEQLRHFPNRGRSREDLSPGLRVIAFERRVDIAYRVNDDRVEILRILYAGRQFDSR